MMAHAADMDTDSVRDLDAKVDLELGPDGHESGTDTKVDVYGEGQ
jgi:hypothetical protein